MRAIVGIGIFLLKDFTINVCIKILSFIPFQTPLTKNNLLAITIFHNTIIFLFMPNIASLQQR